MHKASLTASGLIAIVIGSLAWTGWKLCQQRPIRPTVGSFPQSEVDGSGHSRGLVQVDLIRQIRERQARSTPIPATRIASRDHPLLGHQMPAVVLTDSSGKIWNLGDQVSDGPIVVVFSLGMTCMACVNHLVELDEALPRFRERDARVFAISGDQPGFSTERIRRFGGFEIPLLSDPDHSVAIEFGVWRTDPGGDRNDGQALHGTFVIDRGGVVRWAYVGNRPFTSVEALLTELDRSDVAAAR